MLKYDKMHYQDLIYEEIYIDYCTTRKSELRFENFTNYLS